MNTKLTFRQAKTHLLENKIKLEDEFILKLQKDFKYIAEATNNADIKLLIKLNGITAKIEDIDNLQLAISKLKKLDKHKFEAGSAKRVGGKLISTAIIFDMDPLWQDKYLCTVDQLEMIFDATYKNDYALFFNTLYEITNKRPMSERYTRFLFGKAPKHRKKTEK
jgi:hypothetical protein